MRLLKEPLLHFILIGALLFGIYSLKNRRDAGDITIRISAGRIADLKHTFSNDWNRVPTEEELHTLVDEFVREEMIWREGIAMGLDQDDPVIRQRIQQKLEFMVEEQAARLKPADEELDLFLQQHADLFQEEGVVPPLSEIRNMVLFEWENVQRLKLLEKKYAELYEKYGVVIEGQK